MNIVDIRSRPELIEPASLWFASHWNVPAEAYRDSMHECTAERSAVPQWYLVLSGESIIAGAGIVENDFHNRVDLAPNLCALFVEAAHRGRGVAGKLLAHVCADMRAIGRDPLYLITDHIGFYERYGWTFEGMACDDEGNLVRAYRSPAADIDM